MIRALIVAVALLAGYVLAVNPPCPNCLPPCPTEDSSYCYWDASERGNGLGRDFIALD